jgi:hypothetical protein
MGEECGCLAARPEAGAGPWVAAGASGDNGGTEAWASDIGNCAIENQSAVAFYMQFTYDFQRRWVGPRGAELWESLADMCKALLCSLPEWRHTGRVAGQ